MEKENLMHVKLERLESIEDKKDILSTELFILSLMKEIEEYKKLRKRELDKKIELLKTIKKLNANLNKISRLMPKINYKEDASHKKEYVKEFQELSGNKKTDVEMQLENIQNRLKSLQGKF